MLIVEQSVCQMLRVMDCAYLLEAVALCASGTADLLASEQMREVYLGV